MDEEDNDDHYVTQLKEVFVSCDTSGSGCLNETELTTLCEKLHLMEQTDYFLQELFQWNDVEVKFEDFKNSFVALLSQTSNDENKEVKNEERGENPHVEEVTDREVSPKFTLGRKKYGRRSRPASVVEEDDVLCLISTDESSAEITSSSMSVTYKVNQKSDSGPAKRPVSPSYPQQPPMKSGRMTDVNDIEETNDLEESYQQRHLSNSDGDGGSYFESNPVEYLRQTWIKLEIGCDGYLTVEELGHVCEHIGMIMSDEVISQLFEKLDCDRDGRISFDEFVQGLFQHGEPQESEVLMAKADPVPVFKDQARDEQISTMSISGIFSSIDVNNTGYAEGSSIVELWESLEIPFSPQMLEELGCSQRQKVNLSDLSAILEEEINSCVTTPLGQLALVSYRNEFNYLRQSHEQIRIERNKLRETVEDANSRAVLLAQEIDDNHAKLENTLHDKLVSAEKKHQEQVRELMEDLQQERDSLALQTSKFKQQLQSEMRSIRDEESQLKNRLAELEQENSRLESELQEATERCQETEKQKDMLQKELSTLPALKERLTDLESRQSEIQEHQHQTLVLELKNYKRIIQELQDKIDELMLELENLQQFGGGAAEAPSSVNRTHSWLSDYKNAASIGFKRRGSESSSEENSEDECPTTLKMRRTFLSKEDANPSELEAKDDSRCDSDSQVKRFSPGSGEVQTSTINILLREMFVDQERLKQNFLPVEEQVPRTDFHPHTKYQILSHMTYDTTKTVLA